MRPGRIRREVPFEGEERFAARLCGNFEQKIVDGEIDDGMDC